MCSIEKPNTLNIIHYFIRELLENKDISIGHLRIERQRANIFTISPWCYPIWDSTISSWVMCYGCIIINVWLPMPEYLSHLLFTKTQMLVEVHVFLCQTASPSSNGMSLSSKLFEYIYYILFVCLGCSSKKKFKIRPMCKIVLQIFDNRLRELVHQHGEHSTRNLDY